MDTVSTLISVLIGGGILGFIQFMISRHDKKHDQGKEILDSIQTLSDRVERIEGTLEERDAVQARTHILRFKDELYAGIDHSQEYFEQILDDMEIYSRFCNTHPDFANGRTKAASEYIRSEYDRLFRAHKL